MTPAAVAPRAASVQSEIFVNGTPFELSWWERPEVVTRKKSRLVARGAPPAKERFAFIRVIRDQVFLHDAPSESRNWRDTCDANAPRETRELCSPGRSRVAFESYARAALSVTHTKLSRMRVLWKTSPAISCDSSCDASSEQQKRTRRPHRKHYIARAFSTGGAQLLPPRRPLRNTLV